MGLGQLNNRRRWRDIIVSVAPPDFFDQIFGNGYVLSCSPARNAHCKRISVVSHCKLQARQVIDDADLPRVTPAVYLRSMATRFDSFGCWGLFHER